MRTLVHLSDLHFGRIDPTTTIPLLDLLRELRPHLVVVSGDLTQRARRSQFRLARAFLDELPAPWLAVPGNHDVPLWNVTARFLAPLANWKRFVTRDLAPFWSDDEIAVVGVNTARSLTWKGGRISAEQVAGVRERLCDLPTHVAAILVAHHPFELPAGHRERDLVGRARMAMKALAACGIDVLLTGHLHVHHVASSAERYRIEGHAAIVVQAGTATSSRRRGELNSFNVITIDDPVLEVRPWIWRPDEGAFGALEKEPAQRFTRAGGVWRAVA